tara:strand:- start:317 stop:502 length:186 start_codon:yes stop_codon:yes gene_type:complete
LEDIKGECPFVFIESLICNLAYFYKGSASFEWLETQSFTKLMRLNDEAVKINEKMQPKDKG